jgi:AraC-like DNA-binding protein
VLHACKLLQQTERSITEIALAVGFSDSNYFSRKFRAILGATPREYQQKRNITVPGS